MAVAGMVAIEKIKSGDKVISTDPETMKTSPKTVLETYIREDSKLIHLVVNGEEIVTTETHPFYVNDRGFVNAGELIVGDKLLDVNGNVLLVENFDVELTEKPVTVYNFQVEDFHTYYVGENCVLVHNASCKVNKKGEIEITDWDGYPKGKPKPKGKLKLLQGDDYKAARKAANLENRKIHRKNLNLNGKQIHEIKPVKFGGSPANHSNKIALSRMEHAKLTAFWKSIQAQAEHTLK